MTCHSTLIPFAHGDIAMMKGKKHVLDIYGFCRSDGLSGDPGSNLCLVFTLEICPSGSRRSDCHHGNDAGISQVEVSGSEQTPA